MGRADNSSKNTEPLPAPAGGCSLLMEVPVPGTVIAAVPDPERMRGWPMMGFCGRAGGFRWRRCVVAGAVIVGAVQVMGADTTSASASASELPCSSTTPISYGTAALTGRITNTAEAACFTFGVVTGDQFRFNVRAAPGGISPFTDVFDAGGVSRCATPGDIECPAGSTGTWMAQITASATGSFHIFAQRLNGPVGCRPIAFGSAPLTGRAAAAADAACFTFTGTAGDVIFGHDQNLAGSGSPGMELDGTDGSRLCAVAGGFFTCTLMKTGTQAVLAYYGGTQTGRFSMYVQRMTKPSKCRALTFGAAPRTAKIASTGAVDCFTYSGPVGALVTVDPVVISGTLSPETDAFSPAGLSACATPGELHDCTISSAGTWTALIWDIPGTGKGTFTISATDLDITPLAGPAGTPVTVSSGGFKSGETVRVTYKTGLTSPAKVRICSGVASGTGTVSCSGTVPASMAGALGRHLVQAAGSTSGRTTSGTFTLT
jgi:hypothetical protein